MAIQLFGKSDILEKIIDIKNLSFKYNGENINDEPTLNNITLSINKGEFIAFLGHNGSGKSTLAKMLNGLLKPDSGYVLVNNIDTKDDKNDILIKQTVGMVFQNPDNQIVASIVEEDVAFGAENLGFSSDETRKKVDNALKTVNMYEFKDFPPHKLSGGQKQRVAIAGVLAMEPSCIVFDESTAMLDPTGRKEVIETILKLNKEKGITIILITHNMEETENCDRIAVMDKGEIIALDKPENIFSNLPLLKRAGLSLPQSSELLLKLKQNGINIETKAVSIDKTVNILRDLLEGGNVL